MDLDVASQSLLHNFSARSIPSRVLNPLLVTSAGLVAVHANLRVFDRYAADDSLAFVSVAVPSRKARVLDPRIRLRGPLVKVTFVGWAMGELSFIQATNLVEADVVAPGEPAVVAKLCKGSLKVLLMLGEAQSRSAQSGNQAVSTQVDYSGAISFYRKRLETPFRPIRIARQLGDRNEL